MIFIVNVSLLAIEGSQIEIKIELYLRNREIQPKNKKSNKRGSLTHQSFELSCILDFGMKRGIMLSSTVHKIRPLRYSIHINVPHLAQVAAKKKRKSNFIRTICS